MLTLEWNTNQDINWMIKYDDHKYDVRENSIDALIIIDYMRRRSLTKFINFTLETTMLPDDSIIFVLFYDPE
jgi:hypothetical protein